MIIPTASTGASQRVAKVPLVSDFGLGDDKTISRSVEGVLVPLVSAKLLVKHDAADADINAVISKSITTTLTSAGQITDDGTGDTVAAIQSELAQSETALLTSATFYTISVTDASATAYILERGIIAASAPNANPNGRKRFGNWNLNTSSVEPPSGGSLVLFQELIDDLDQGEAYTFTRKIQGAIPVGWSLGTLTFTVRRAATDPDGAAIVQKVVTPGSIGPDATYPVFVTLTAADTALLIGAMVWDAKVALTNGGTTKRYTVAVGTMDAQGPLPAVGVLSPPIFAMTIATPPTIGYAPVQLALTMADAGGTPIAPATRVVNWGTSNKAVASVSQTGLVTAVASGTADIVATSEGVEVRATVNVSPLVFSVTVTPNPISALAIGSTQALTVVVRDAANEVLTGRSIIYTSSDPLIASVDSSGTVHAVAGGNATITVTSEGIASTIPTTVQAPVATVIVTPSPFTVGTGATQQLTVVLKDSLGNVLTGRTITYASTDTSKATVNSTGLVTGVAVGGCTINVTAEGITTGDTATVILVNDVTALVTTLGGDTAVLGIYDVRYGVTVVTTSATQWDDARGSSGFGPSLAVGAGQAPDWTGGADSAKLITFANGGGRVLQSSAISALDISTPKTFVIVCSTPTPTASVGYLGGFNDSASVNGAILIATTSSGIIRGEFYPGGAQVDTTLATSTTRRVLYLTTNGSTTGKVEAPTKAQQTGTISTIGSRSCALVLGTYWVGHGVAGGQQVRAVIALSGSYTSTQRDAIDAWAVANHAAVLA